MKTIKNYEKMLYIKKYTKVFIFYFVGPEYDEYDDRSWLGTTDRTASHRTKFRNPDLRWKIR